jgi:hypothetical protein
VLGRQGLWPGQRWKGKPGTEQVIRSCKVIKLDPPVVIARSQDFVLCSRVLDYKPEYLYQVMYEDREFFDYGGHLNVYPMSELPYWRHYVESAATTSVSKTMSLSANYIRGCFFGVDSLAAPPQKTVSSILRIGSMSFRIRNCSLKPGIVAPLRDEAGSDRFLVLCEDITLFESLEAGKIPKAWKAKGPTTQGEVSFLAPLDIVRAQTGE